jgi:hypothetical protein
MKKNSTGLCQSRGGVVEMEQIGSLRSLMVAKLNLDTFVKKIFFVFLSRFVCL